MADYSKQDIFDIITEYLEQYGSAIGSGAVHELTPQELTDENLRVLTIPGMRPDTEEWVQTSMKNMMRPINDAVSDLDTLKSQTLEAAGLATTAAGTCDTARQQIESQESARQSQEQTRQAQEQTRQTQEQARVTEFATLKSQSETATSNANEASTHPTKVDASGWVYEWDMTTHAYNKTDKNIRGRDFHVDKVFQSIAEMDAYVDEDMEHEFVTQKLAHPIYTGLVDLYCYEVLRCAESYDPSNTEDGNSPLQEYKWGLALAVMRGGGAGVTKVYHIHLVPSGSIDPHSLYSFLSTGSWRNGNTKVAVSMDVVLKAERSYTFPVDRQNRCFGIFITRVPHGGSPLDGETVASWYVYGEVTVETYWSPDPISDPYSDDVCALLNVQKLSGYDYYCFARPMGIDYEVNASDMEQIEEMPIDDDPIDNEEPLLD